MTTAELFGVVFGAGGLGTAIVGYISLLTKLKFQHTETMKLIESNETARRDSVEANETERVNSHLWKIIEQLQDELVRTKADYREEMKRLNERITILESRNEKLKEDEWLLKTTLSEMQAELKAVKG